MKCGEEKGLSKELKTKQLEKGTFDSPCMSVCNYEGLFKECGTCGMRKAEKSLWKQGDSMMKDQIIRSISRRQTS